MNKRYFNFAFCILHFALLFPLSCKNKSGTPATETTDSVSTAADALTARIKEDPNNAELYYQRGKWYLAEKRSGLAEMDIRHALSIDSSKAAYYLALADVTFSKMDVLQAEEAFNKALALDPDNLDAHLRMAELELYIKNYDLAIQHANAVLRIDKHKAKAYFLKGFVYKESKDTARAISSFQTAVEQEPNYYDAFIQLGNLYAAKKNATAVQYYNRALQLRPGSAEAFYNRGLFYQNAGLADKAEEDYNELIKIDPHYVNGFYNLGYIEMAYRQNFKKAIEYFTTVIERDQYYVEAYYNRGFCYEKLGDKTNARINYQAALQHAPKYQLPKDGLKRIGG